MQYTNTPINQSISRSMNSNISCLSSLTRNNMDTSINSTLLLNPFNPAFLNQSLSGNNSFRTSALLNQSLHGNNSLLPSSINMNQPLNENHFDQQSIKAIQHGQHINLSQLNHPQVSNGHSNPFLNQPLLKSHIAQQQQMPSMAPQNSITMPCQASVSISNNVSSMGLMSTNRNSSCMPPTTNSFTNSTNYSQQESELNKKYEEPHDNDRDKHFKEQKITTQRCDEDDGLEEFPGGSSYGNQNDDEVLDDIVKEEFSENTKVDVEDGSSPFSFYDLDNNEQLNLTDSFKGTEYTRNLYPTKRHSLYHPDLDRRSKKERRKSSMIIANMLKKLGEITDDSSEEIDYEEEERVNNTKRKFDDIEKLRESLRESLKVDEIITQNCKKVDRRKSQRASLVLRQSVLNSLAYPDSKKKTSLKNVEGIYLPHMFHTRIDRRRSTIIERSSELLKVFGPEYKVIPRESVKQILPDILDPAATDMLISSVLRSSSSGGFIDEGTLELLRELDEEDEELRQSPLKNGYEVNEQISSEMIHLSLETGDTFRT